MTRLGIVGGLGPESTIDYYRRILERWQASEPTTAPSIIIDSLDVQYGIRLVETDHHALIEYLLHSIQRLAVAGADFAAMAANTPHIVFDEVVARSPIPMLSIVEASADEAVRLGWRRPALLGTGFTMGARFYPEILQRRGIDVIVPDAPDRAWIHDRYIHQLLLGQFRDETRAEFVVLVERLRETERIDGIILGGTELPLLLGESIVAGVPALDTTEAHVAAIVARLRAGTAALAR